jgi:hypothetical protein
MGELTKWNTDCLWIKLNTEGLMDIIFKNRMLKYLGLLIPFLILLPLFTQNAIAQTVYSNCATCHNETTSSSTGKINLSAMNLSSNAVHRNLTEGITNDTPISDNVIKTCWACHWNGTDPNTTHPNKTAFTPWLCYDCHSNTTGGITDASSDVTNNYSAPAVYAHIPQNAMNSITGSADRTDITTSVQCWFCHNRSVGFSNDTSGPPENNTAQANVSHYGTNQSLISTTNCDWCHKDATNASLWYYQPNASSASEPGGRDLSEYINLTIRHPAAYANNIPNYTVCKYCHNSTSVDSFHSQDLVMPVYVHRDYDWEGDGDAPFGTPKQAPQEGESCIACHQKMFGVSSTDPVKTCEDCHVVNLSTGRPNGPFTTGPFTFTLRSDYNQSVPLVYEHWNGSISGLFTPEVKTKNMSTGWGSTTTLSTCFAWNTNDGNGTCHGVSWENRSDPDNIYFAFNRSLSDTDPSSEKNMIPYKYGQGPIDFLPRSTNCTFCHIDLGQMSDNPTRRARWGYPPTINSSNSSLQNSMYNATTLDDCYLCHVTTTQAPNFFHDQNLTAGGTPDCVDCHDIGKSTAPDVDISVMNASPAIHGLLNNGSTDPGNTSDPNQQYDWNNRRCWACHSNGSVPPSGMGLNYLTPWLCYDCHSNTTGGITDASSDVTSNYSAPAVYAHIPQNAMNSVTGSADRTNITTSVQCWFCHNRSVLNSNDSEEGVRLTNYSISNVSHYGTNQSLINTTNCDWCHKDATNASLWYFQANVSGREWDVSNYVNLTIRHPAAYERIPNYTVCKYCHK